MLNSVRWLRLVRGWLRSASVSSRVVSESVSSVRTGSVRSERSSVAVAVLVAAGLHRDERPVPRGPGRGIIWSYA